MAGKSRPYKRDISELAPGGHDWASGSIHMYELSLSEDCTGVCSGLIQHTQQAQRITIMLRAVGWEKLSNTGGERENMNGREARVILCIFVCCLHLLGIISRQEPQPQDAWDRARLRVSKKSGGEVRKLMRRMVIWKGKEGIRKYERRTQVGLIF